MTLTNSRVILNVNASPESITQFHDELSNELPNLKGNWSFSFKIFRNNQYSIPPDKIDKIEVADDAKFLHTFSPSYLKESCISLVNKRLVGVFTDSIQEETSDNKIMTIPDQHLHYGATIGINDAFDMFVTHKAQSIWTLRQNIRGDGGQIYELENGNLTIKTSNIFLHGMFKGLLIEVNVDDHIVEHKDTEYLNTLFGRIINNYNIPTGNICFDLLDNGIFDSFGDLCLQYAEILNF